MGKPGPRPLHRFPADALLGHVCSVRVAETSTLTVYTSPKKSRLKKLRTAAGAVIRNIWEPLAMASAVSAGVSGELGWWWVGAMCVWLSSHLVYRRSAQKRREP